MQILVIDAALAGCQAAVVRDGAVLSVLHQAGSRGQSSRLADMVRTVLVQSQAGETLSWIAVTLGPGSFTGIRSALSLAHGLGLALDVPVIGVTVGEALSQAAPFETGRKLWCVTASRRNRVFLERDGVAVSLPMEFLPLPEYPVAIAGDAAIPVAVSLAARSADVMLTAARLPSPGQIASASWLRKRGDLPPRASQPFYVDAPEVSQPRERSAIGFTKPAFITADAGH